MKRQIWGNHVQCCLGKVGKRLFRFFVYGGFLSALFSVLAPSLHAQTGVVGGLKGEYYNGKAFETFVGLRADEQVNFNWGSGAAMPGVGADSFSVRWEGGLYVPEDGAYTFYVTSDDGARLWVNGQPVINGWVNGSATRSGVVTLTGQQWVSVKLEYFENTGGATARLEWSGPSIARQVVAKGNLRMTVGEAGNTLPAPTGLHLTRQGRGLLTLEWSEVDGAKGYAIYRDGQLAGVSGGTEFTDRGLVAGTEYAYTVRALELDLSVGGVSAPVSAGTLASHAGGTGFKAEYYDEMNLTVRKGVRLEEVDFNWGNGSPLPTMGADTFSARWSGEIMAAESGAHTLFVTSDDGVRLWVDGKLLIDRWVNQGGNTHQAIVEMEAGRTYEVRLEYFENTGGALARLEWATPTQARQVIPLEAANGIVEVTATPPSAPGALHSRARTETSIVLGWQAPPGDGVVGYKIYRDGQYEGYTMGTDYRVGGLDGATGYGFEVRAVDAGLNESIGLTGTLSTLAVRPPGSGQGLRAEYFNGKTLEELVAVQVEGPVNFNWGSGAPLPGMPVDGFSARWTGQIGAVQGGTHTLFVTSDDGVRLWVDGKLLIDRWVNQGPTTVAVQVDMIAGRKYEVMLEYYENTGGALVRLEWEAAGMSRQVIPVGQLYTLEDSSDTTPPPAPSGLRITDKAFTAVTLEWDSPAETADVYGYVVYRDGEVAGLVAGAGNTQYRDRGLSPGSRYEYTVRAYDGVLNESAASPALVVKTTDAPGAGAGTGLWGWYYDNTDFTSLMMERLDAVIQFNWGSGSPHPSMGADTFSVRWKGQVRALHSEEYTFYVTSDDGTRLWVDGKLLINRWVNQGSTESQGTIVLEAGRIYDIRLEYYENTGGANVSLSWSSVSQLKQIIPVGALYPQLKDSDGDGMPDLWELQHGFNPFDPSDGAGDIDGDGISNRDEYFQSLDPLDYYNGVLPQLTILSGNGQTGAPGQYAAEPLIVRVAEGLVGLSNAPVQFAVTGEGGVATGTNGVGAATILDVRTDGNGLAQVWYQAGTTLNLTNLVSAQITSGTNAASVTFNVVTVNPLAIPVTDGLKMWLKADEGVVTNSSGKVQEWSDLTGNGHHAIQPNESRRPQIVTGALNDKPVIRFDGQDDVLGLVDASGTVMSNVTVFVVHKINSGEVASYSGAHFMMFLGGNVDQPYQYWGLVNEGEDAVDVIAGWANNRRQSLEQAAQEDVFKLWSVTTETMIHSSRFFANGREATPMNIGQNGAVTFTIGNPTGTGIGGLGGAPALWTGHVAKWDVAEIIVYQRVLNEAERQEIEQYLAVKYALPLDRDGNGLDDAWEMEYFGGTGVDANADPDGDGLTNLQEFQNGTNPLDYYNGQPVIMEIVSGNVQQQAGQGVFAEPLIVQVTGTNGVALANAPVQIALTEGAAVLVPGLTETNGVASLSVRTDSQGHAQTFVYSTSDEAGTVAVQFAQEGGLGSVTFALQVIPPAADASVFPVRGASQSMAGRGTNGVWSVWGRSHFGQSGLNRETILSAPEIVGNYTDVAIGARHGLAVSNGTLVVWGDNAHGQLGLGANAGSLSPLLLTNHTDIAQVASGARHSLAILTNGQVMVWGDNRSGQSAMPADQLSVNAPVLVNGIGETVIQVAGGREFSIALDDQGRVYVWGDNRHGQLAQTALTKANPFPAQIAPLTNIQKVAAGSLHAGALSSNGTLWVWGGNSSGQLGQGSRGVNQRAPQAVTNLGVVKDFGMGAAHTVILTTNGNVYVSGANHYHQLGTNTGTLLNASPVLLTNLPDAVSVSVVGDSSFIARADGSYLVWGDNRYGQLGLSNVLEQTIPVILGGLP